MLYLQQFDFTFQHRPGKHHANANAMSRVCSTQPILPVLLQPITADLDSMKAAQQDDASLSGMIMALTSGQPIPPRCYLRIEACFHEGRSFV